MTKRSASRAVRVRQLQYNYTAMGAILRAPANNHLGWIELCGCVVPVMCYPPPPPPNNKITEGGDDTGESI